VTRAPALLAYVAMAGLLVLAAEGAAGSQRGGQRGGQLEALPEVPEQLAFIPIDVAERMLALAQVTKNDVVYDLGCGDGRIAILAAKKYGAKAVGVDTDARRIEEATANAAKEGVSSLVRFVRGDTADVSEATVVTISIPQSAAWLTRNELLHPGLTKQLKPRARFVTNFVAGSMKALKPDRIDRFSDARGNPRATLYLWRLPFPA
jgi:SAM-dependent methyltransferase